MIPLIRSLYFQNRFFIALGLVVLLFVISFSFPVLFVISQLTLLVVILLLLADMLLLYRVKRGIHGKRICPDKLSNGDENEITLTIENYYNFEAHLSIIDEIPAQFQIRNFSIELTIPKNSVHTLNYTLRPVKRGAYHFGAVNIFAGTNIQFIRRRFRFSQSKAVPVYPSFIQMRKYELLAISNRLTEFGIKKIRRIGQNREFEQIKEYVVGDDYRTINWKATARRSTLMVNTYQDERAQQVYAVIDKGRTMKMPFEGMTLLDYAINASLVISNIAIRKEDKAGLIAFQHKVQTIVPASRRNRQLLLLMEALYKQKTAYKEANFAALYATVKRKITQRSLLLLFTNFESVSGLERQLPYLRRLATQHLLIVIFFRNTELYALLDQKATHIEEVYHKTIAEKFAFEKNMIVDELAKYGIQAVLTTPQHLSVDTINKYLELKARGLI